MFHKLVVKIGVVIFLFLGLVQWDGLSMALERHLVIGSGPTFGSYFPVATGITQCAEKTLPDTKFQVMITKGSQDNVMLVGMQRADLGIAVADSLEQGYTGSAPEKYPKPLSHLRALGALFPNYVHLFATQASGIKTLEDFKGKRISAGSKGSGGHLNFENIMKAAGLKYSDFAKTEFVNYSQTIELMQNRRVDATSMTSGLGVASVRQISSSIPIRFIPMSPEFVKSMNNTSYVSSKLPANSYKGQTDPMDTFTVWAIVFTHSRLSDEAAYNIVKAIYEHPDIMAAAHEANKDVSLNNALTGIPCPLHPGAEKYYREKGVLK